MVAPLASLTPSTDISSPDCRGSVLPGATIVQRALTLLLALILSTMLVPGGANAQLSRDEHDRLRLELRQGLHRPVRVGTLQELGLPARLTASERRLLRRQLREQHESVGQVRRTGSFRAPEIASRPDTSDSVGGEVPEAELAGRVIPASTARPDTIRLDSSMLGVQGTVSVSH